jgi:23S rRNA (adenine2503-C2)-methyltransferase
MNMIPYNTIPDLPYRRPAWEKAADIARQLHRRGILTKLRNSAGQDVDGGCGQLRARSIAMRHRSGWSSAQPAEARGVGPTLTSSVSRVV